MEYFDQVLEYFDQVLESLVCDGKFWFNFPGHGYQNFISKIWSFQDFFFQDLVPSHLFCRKYLVNHGHQEECLINTVVKGSNMLMFKML